MPISFTRSPEDPPTLPQSGHLKIIHHSCYVFQILYSVKTSIITNAISLLATMPSAETPKKVDIHVYITHKAAAEMDTVPRKDYETSDHTI